MNRKYLIPLLLVLVAFSCFAYISFFAYNIKMLTDNTSEEKHQYQYHVLIGSTEGKSEFMEEFYEGARYICPVFDAAVELLEPSSDSDPVENSMEHWFEYAGLVDADGLILVSRDGSFQVRRVLDSRSEEIPVVLAGECDVESHQLSHVLCSPVEYAKLAAAEIRRGGWKKPVALIRRNSRSEISEKIVTALSDSGIDVEIHYLNSEDVIDDEVHKALRTFIKEKTADVIQCFNADETNLVAQMLVDQNSTEQPGIIGFNGDNKTKDYIKKGIVDSVIYVDAWQMGAASAEELFKWKNSGSINNMRRIAPRVIQGGAK